MEICLINFYILYKLIKKAEEWKATYPLVIYKNFNDPIKKFSTIAVRNTKNEVICDINAENAMLVWELMIVLRFKYRDK